MAWLEVENTRRAQAGERVIRDWVQQLRGSPTAQHGLDRLLSRNQKAMVDSLIDQLAGDRGLISDPEVVLALEEMAGLSDRELDGMLELKRYVDRSRAHGGFPRWDEILFTEPSRRRNLLELVADLRNPARPGDLVVNSGMEDVVSATLQHGANIQGGLGHLETARSLLHDFPGARFRFEVTQLAGGVRRDVDIVVEMQVAGRLVDVEVKGYQATTGLDHVRRQISKDLMRHLGDPGAPVDGPPVAIPRSQLCEQSPRRRAHLRRGTREARRRGQAPHAAPARADRAPDPLHCGRPMEADRCPALTGKEGERA